MRQYRFADALIHHQRIHCFRLRRGYNLHGREAWVEVSAGEAAGAVLRKGQRPAKSAVTMANALLFEHDLITGRFKSVREARKAYCITRGVSQAILQAAQPAARAD